MIELTGSGLSIEDVVAVARDGTTVAPLSDETIQRIERSYDWLHEAVAAGETIYGVNTGFGSLANRRIASHDMKVLSRNVVLKCVVGVGSDLPADVVRGMLLIRANSLAKGVSAVRPVLVDTLLRMLEAGVTPRIPSKGSLGASGDLAPLAHMAAVMTRGPDGDRPYSGEAWYDGELLSGEEAMAGAGIERLVLEAKEGLALTNGTTMMVAAGALAIHDAESLLAHAHLAAALSMEGLMALSEALHPALHEANGQSGQIEVASRLRALLADSGLINGDETRVQDAYSIRCTPQVLGPAVDLVAFLRERFTAAINAAADNPLFFVDLPGRERKAISGGNFHGQGPALWMDLLGIGIAELASIAERRCFRMLTPELSGGLPAMLVEEAGLNGGLMMAQYTAAALVSDNKTLAHPDSVDSIVTSAGQEDHVSMGANAARHTLEILENVSAVIAIELLTAAQAVDLRSEGRDRLGRGSAPVHRLLRERIAFLERDRELTPDILAILELMRTGELVQAADRALEGVS